MGMFDWFRRLTGQGDAAPGNRDAAPPSAAETEAGGLDFYKAIEAHQRWKVRLSAYVNGESAESLDWTVICRDDQCALGQWLHGGARAPMGHEGLFSRLVEEHAQFHQCAGEVVQLADRGNKDAALKLIGTGAYARASRQVISSLGQLFLAIREPAQVQDANV